MTQNTFTAFREKNHHARLDNVILGQLKMGEHQVKFRALILHVSSMRVGNGIGMAEGAVTLVLRNNCIPLTIMVVIETRLS